MAKITNTVKVTYCPNKCQGYKEIVQQLIDKGANVNAVDRHGRTVLDEALEIGDKHKGNSISIFQNTEQNRTVIR